jgi:hypothetical protein
MLKHSGTVFWVTLFIVMGSELPENHSAIQGEKFDAYDSTAYRKPSDNHTVQY